MMRMNNKLEVMQFLLRIMKRNLTKILRTQMRMTIMINHQKMNKVPIKNHLNNLWRPKTMH